MKNSVTTRGRMKDAIAKPYNFYQTPKFLFKDETFSSVSNNGRILYSLLRDRFDLSVKNQGQFSNENSEIFVIHTREEMGGMLNRFVNTVTGHERAERVRAGGGGPARVGQGQPHICYGR